jgi:hypothetical protein
MHAAFSTSPIARFSAARSRNLILATTVVPAIIQEREVAGPLLDASKHTMAWPNQPGPFYKV